MELILASLCILLLAACILIIHLHKSLTICKENSIELQDNLDFLKESLNHQEVLETQITAMRSTLSHQLRMPLSIIKGYAELLRDDIVTDPQLQRNYLEKIAEYSTQLADLISQHHRNLDSYEISAPYCQTVSLLPLVRQVADDLHTTAQNHGIQIQVLSTQETIHANADPNLIRTVLFNLFENALNYMGREGLILTRLESREKQVAITVQDDGLGLSPEETAQMFDLEFRGSNATELAGQGQGLHMVQQIIQAHGGTITARSSLGHGMRIQFTLPIATPS